MESLTRHEAAPEESGQERVALHELSGAVEAFVERNNLTPESPVNAVMKSQDSPVPGERTITKPARLLGLVLEQHANELLALFEDPSTPPPTPKHGILIHLSVPGSSATRLFVPRG